MIRKGNEKHILLNLVIFSDSFPNGKIKYYLARMWLVMKISGGKLEYLPTCFKIEYLVSLLGAGLGQAESEQAL